MDKPVAKKYLELTLLLCSFSVNKNSGANPSTALNKTPPFSINLPSLNIRDLPPPPSFLSHISSSNLEPSSAISKSLQIVSCNFFSQSEISILFITNQFLLIRNYYI